MSKCISNNFDVVSYERIEYDVRYVTISHDDGDDPIDVMVSTDKLEEILFDKQEQYRDLDARALDESIYCYVPEDVLKTYSDEEFQKYVEENYS